MCKHTTPHMQHAQSTSDVRMYIAILVDTFQTAGNWACGSLKLEHLTRLQGLVASSTPRVGTASLLLSVFFDHVHARGA